jgi:cold-inducible RNA-binding protein
VAARRNGSPAERSDIISAKIFVGNLDFQTTVDEITALLSGAGQVVDVYLPSDHRTGRPRGFAFVEFSSEAEAAEAITKFNGQELLGRKLNINAAEDRPRRDDSPRSFRPGPPPPGGGGFGADRRPFKSKGSRKGLRGRKRSL